MKKVLAISSVLLGIVFLAGCGQQPVSQTQPTTPAPVVQTPTQPAATQSVNNDAIPVPADWKIYKNPNYKFSFSYPSDWFVINAVKDKKIYIQTTNNVNENMGSAPKNFKRVWIAYDQKSAIDNPDSMYGKVASINGIQVKISDNTNSKDSGGNFGFGAKWTVGEITYVTQMAFPGVSPDSAGQDTLKKIVYSLQPVK